MKGINGKIHRDSYTFERRDNFLTMTPNPDTAHTRAHTYLKWLSQSQKYKYCLLPITYGPWILYRYITHCMYTWQKSRSQTVERRKWSNGNGGDDEGEGMCGDDAQYAIHTCHTARNSPDFLIQEPGLWTSHWSGNNGERPGYRSFVTTLSVCDCKL